MAKTRWKATGKGSPGSFLQLPHALLRHPNYAALDAFSVKLLIDVAGQYNGTNNGNLACTLVVLDKYGWVSNSTLTRAKNRLVDAGFLQLMRQGGLRMGPSLYAITWKELNHAPAKYSYDAAKFVQGAWKNESPTPVGG
jgi:hypothetical protein